MRFVEFTLGEICDTLREAEDIEKEFSALQRI